MTWAIFRDGNHEPAIKEIIEGSDRVAAVVGAAMLDGALHRTLSERFRNDKDVVKKLLKPSGAIGNAVPKIDVLYLLHAFDKPTRDAMYGLCAARNYCAHHLPASFNAKAKEMVDAIKLLTLHESRKVYPHHMFRDETKKGKEPIEAVNNNRDRFVVNLKLCLIALMQDRCSHYTWTNRPMPVEKLRQQLETGEQPQPGPEQVT